MRSPTADPELATLTVPETARQLGISVRHGYRLAELGQLPGAFRLGDRVLVNRAALLAWQARLVAAAESTAVVSRPD